MCAGERPSLTADGGLRGDKRYRRTALRHIAKPPEFPEQPLFAFVIPNVGECAAMNAALSRTSFALRNCSCGRTATPKAEPPRAAARDHPKPKLLRGACAARDRKSTRLNSSHGYISYA